jgi:hypothetical protein
MFKGFLLGAVFAGLTTYTYAAMQWYSIDNVETRAYVEFLNQRDYYPPDIEPAKPKNALPTLKEGYNARKDGPVWLTVEDLG